ncbi:hypothetical protein BH11ARM2_BH11ARM2_22110 [soil metagenome]
MPVTTAHPLVAVPLARLGLPLSALTIGSMAPDFPYFLHWPADSHYGHSWEGFFTLSLPLGVVGLVAFHGLFKLPLLSLFPTSHQEKLLPAARAFRIDSVSKAVLALLAVFLGAVTHIAWDSFTHFYGWPVQHLAFLRDPIGRTFLGSITGYKLVQYASGIGGTAALIYLYFAWIKKDEFDDEEADEALPWPSPKGRLGMVLIFLLISTIVALLYATLKTHRGIHMQWIQDFARFAILMGGASLVLQIVLYSLYWRFRFSPRTE